MPWTIDPGKVQTGQAGSREVSLKAVRLFESRVIVHLGRVRFPNGNQLDGFRVPSWTTPGDSYVVNLLTHPDGTREAEDNCPSVSWCHHGYACALEADRLDRETKRRRLTVIPGGKAS